MSAALPDLERRLDIFTGDRYGGEYWVTSMGYLAGTFTRPWLGIQPTGGLFYLRIGEFYRIRDGLINKAHVLLDIPDLMRQAGVDPLPPMSGTPGPVPGPLLHNGLRLGPADTAQESLDTVLAMHRTLIAYDGQDQASMQHEQF